MRQDYSELGIRAHHTAENDRKDNQVNYTSTIQTGFQAVQVNLDYEKPHHWLRDKPDWFTDLIARGELAAVKNAKDRYISVLNKNGSMRAYEGDWIVRNVAGLIFVMPNELFVEGFRGE